MSLGLAPEDEEIPGYGPPVPGSPEDYIAGINAQPAPPVAAPFPQVDENAWPPPVPAEAPGAMPPPAPGVPGAAPPPVAPGPPAPAPGTVADVAQAGAKAISSRRAADESQLGVVQAGQAHDQERQDLAQDKSDNARLEQADIAAQLEASKAAESQAQKIYDQAAANKRNFQFKDFWADKGTARRVGSAIAVAFGAYGAALAHTQNYALEILNKEMDDDHRNQVDQFSRLNDAELTARTGIADVRAARVQGLTDIGVKSAAANRAIAEQADAAAAKQTSDENKAKLQAFANDLRAKADETEYTTKMGIYNAVRSGATAEAKNTETAAHTRLLNAQAGKIAGAAAGGARNDAALRDLARYAEQPGVTQADVVAKATQLGIKKPLDVAIKVAKDPEKIAAAARVAEDKEAAAEVRDANGNVLGVASTPRAAAPLNAMVAASKNYKDAIEAYRAHILEHGREFNPLSDDYKERERLHADVVAKGRPFAQLGVSNANLDLEHKIIGGSGTGFSRMSSPESLAKLSDEVDQITNARIKTALRQPHGGAAAGAGAPASPASAMVTIKNNKTGETKQVTREQAKAMGVN